MTPLSQGWIIQPQSYDSSNLTGEALPYAEILARQVAGFLKVEVWHNGRYKDALFPYLQTLWEALVEDGFEVAWVDQRPWLTNLIDWAVSLPPFAEGDKADQLVERWVSGSKEDDGVGETAVSNLLNHELGEPNNHFAVYPYSARHFQAFMEHFRSRYGGVWESDDGQKLSIEDQPTLNNDTRVYWHVDKYASRDGAGERDKKGNRYYFRF